MQDFVWSVRVSAADKGTEIVRARKHQFQVGSSVQFDVDDERISGVEYVLGAIAADVINGLRDVARRHRVDIDTIEATVQGELNNPLTYLNVVGEEGHPGLERICVKVYVSSLCSQPEVESVWQEALRRSPLVTTFQSAVDLQLTWKLVL